MNTSLINALGLTLAHFLWEGAAIALLLLLFWRAGARVRYAAACAALAAMPVACLLTFWLVQPAIVLAPAPRVIARALDRSAAGALDFASTPVPISLWRWIVPLWLAGVAVFYLRSVGGLSSRRPR